MSVASGSFTLLNASPGESEALGYGTQHAAGAGHNQGSRHALTRCVPHDDAQLSVLQLEEVVEVSSYLSGWLVEWGDLPAP